MILEKKKITNPSLKIWRTTLVSSTRIKATRRKARRCVISLIRIGIIHRYKA